MPVSSTVWCPSTCRSPWASTVRSSSAVPRERVEHVVEEADARPHGRRRRGRRGRRRTWRSVSLVVRRISPMRGTVTSPLRLTRSSHPCAHARPSPRISPSASATASMSSVRPDRDPQALAPAPAAPETSRTRMPCSSQQPAEHLPRRAAPWQRISTKLAALGIRREARQRARAARTSRSRVATMPRIRSSSSVAWCRSATAAAARVTRFTL